MDRKTLQKLNHPKLGSSIKVEPIRSLAAIRAIKDLLHDNPRNLCLFTLGINTAYRANEILSVTVGQVMGLKPGDRLDLKQSKNRKYRATTLNRTAISAIDNWLSMHPDPKNHMPLFPSQRRRRRALGVSALSRLVKFWCSSVGLNGNYASHTLRKTWGFQQRMKGASVPLLMLAFGHAAQEQTLEYLCIQESEVESLYELEL